MSSFGTLMAAHRGEVVCVVTTAKVFTFQMMALQINLLLQELDAANKKEVEGALAGFLKSGEKALISYAVDASIVGGMVVSCTTLDLAQLEVTCLSLEYHPSPTCSCSRFLNSELVSGEHCRQVCGHVHGLEADQVQRLDQERCLNRRTCHQTFQL